MTATASIRAALVVLARRARNEIGALETIRELFDAAIVVAVAENGIPTEPARRSRLAYELGRVAGVRLGCAIGMANADDLFQQEIAERARALNEIVPPTPEDSGPDDREIAARFRASAPGRWDDTQAEDVRHLLAVIDRLRARPSTAEMTPGREMEIRARNALACELASEGVGPPLDHHERERRDLLARLDAMRAELVQILDEFENVDDVREVIPIVERLRQAHGITGRS